MTFPSLTVGEPATGDPAVLTIRSDATPLVTAALGAILVLLAAEIAPAWADGKVFAPRSYSGSLEEQSQEAILIHTRGADGQSATQDLILKITVSPSVDSFAWVVAFPAVPTVKAEDAELFAELFDYVEARKQSRRQATTKDGLSKAGEVNADVAVVSRQTVGKFDVAVVRETQDGGLAKWLAAEGYQGLPNNPDATALIAEYRRRGFVFAAVKVSDAAKADTSGGAFSPHPLRFTFQTTGRDGIYFPMRLTGLQSQTFSVNLHVFCPSWINDRLNGFGFVHRGFSLRHRDWDSPNCRPNAGKAWSAPDSDPYLYDQAHRLNAVKALFAKLYPGQRFYLTNITATLKPADVLAWRDELWLFPYYTDRDMIPFDARPGGPAAAAYGTLTAGGVPESVNEATTVRPESHILPMASAAFVGRAAGVLGLMGLAALAVLGLSAKPR